MAMVRASSVAGIDVIRSNGSAILGHVIWWRNCCMETTPEMARDGEIDLGALIEAQPRSAFSVAVLVWSCMLMLVEGYDMQVMAYAAPAIIVDWHISDRAVLGPVFGAGLFGYMLGATILSHLADRFGRKRIILAGFWLFGAFTLAAAFAPSLGWLLVLRFVAGLGLGGSIPTAIALNAEYAP